MKTIILAAGLGTRLGEIGKMRPKCLVEIAGKTILERQIEILKKAGLNEIFVVIGEKGECWTQENKEKIGKINENVIINYDNDKTNNSYSLRLAINKLDKDDLLIIDGDLIFSQDLIEKAIFSEKNLILSKKTNNKEDPGNRVITDKNGKVLNVGRKLPKENPVYGAIIKTKRENYEDIKEIVNKEKYYNLDLGFVLDELCKKIDIYNFSNNRLGNINKKEDLEEAQKLLQKNFLILMFGYTATGKSVLAKKIARIPNTNIFHSAVIRKELGLDKFKTAEEADRFFDYRNKLRDDVDKKVYGKLAELAEISLKNRKNVILDAGYFFSWQRQLIYDKAKILKPEIFVIKITCKDEKEIKRRLKEREEKFGTSPLAETPSWNAYISGKISTEPLEKDILPENLKVNVIEYDTLTEELKLVQGEESSNAKRIMKKIKSGSFLVQDEDFNFVEIPEDKIQELTRDKFVVALDFDGVITAPYKLKTAYINQLGYNIKEEQCSAQNCLKSGIPKEDYDKEGIKAYIETPDKLFLEKGFAENFSKLKNLDKLAIFIVSSRYDSMINHLQEYMKHYKIKVDGIIHTKAKSKSDPLYKIKADVFIEDSPFKIGQIIEEAKKILDKCTLVLFRNISNKLENSPDKKIIEIDNWNDLYKLIEKRYNEQNKVEN